jgi:hypothetical protein
VPWVPNVGERVAEAGVEDEFGTVLRVDGTSATVLWDDYKQAQPFEIDDLEPVDESEAEEPIKEGDSIEYHNPFFARPFKGIALRVGDGVTFIRFPAGGMADGFYNNEFIQKAA